MIATALQRVMHESSPHRPSRWEMRSGPAATTWPGRWGDGWGIAGG